MPLKRIRISKDILSYATAARGDWHFKASVYKQDQILIIAFNPVTFESFTQVFVNYHEAIAFLEMLSEK